MNRRSFLAIGGVALLSRHLSAATRSSSVETTAGTIRGYVEDGVHIFKGVRYGDSTARDSCLR
jgi:para-nitrobenzyl esterase